MDVNEPHGDGEDCEGEDQCSPEEFVFAKEADVDENHTKAVEAMQEKKQKEQDINGCVEMDLFCGAEKFRQVRHISSGGPAGIDLDWDQEEEAEGADALGEPGPGAAVALEAFFH